jgi:hypothetical protein
MIDWQLKKVVYEVQCECFGVGGCTSLGKFDEVERRRQAREPYARHALEKAQIVAVAIVAFALFLSSPWVNLVASIDCSTAASRGYIGRFLSTQVSLKPPAFVGRASVRATSWTLPCVPLPHLRLALGSIWDDRREQCMRERPESGFCQSQV